ncbi:MAG TPA: bifunctional NADH-specific enoyl-ACP reductase/trans-2-enoyl-CoA reductase, partial [Sediminispirochaeta sp.]|nr:bifunctional NADH-specific enoyl-ACP reductase/trans-2-enoyl-CoA reductase [Sediminispirochaeta sp.]
MVISPKIRGGICMNAHPAGCAQEVKLQKQIVEQSIENSEHGSVQGPRTVLVIGGSTGYGLAARLVGAFGYGADTISVSYEKEPSDKRPATPGWYNTRAFDLLAEKEGLSAVSLNADAFSHDTRQRVVEILQEKGKKIDLLVYSLASGVRPD